MPKLILTVGIQGAGKSYYVDHNFVENESLLITGNDRDPASELKRKINKAKNDKLSIVIDNMHHTLKSRKKRIKEFMDTHSIECHYFYSNNELSWKRVKERKTNKISKSKIKDCLISLEPPTLDEGYSRLFFHDESSKIHEIH